MRHAATGVKLEEESRSQSARFGVPGPLPRGGMRKNILEKTQASLRSAQFTMLALIVACDSLLAFVTSSIHEDSDFARMRAAYF